MGVTALPLDSLHVNSILTNEKQTMNSTSNSNNVKTLASIFLPPSAFPKSCLILRRKDSAFVHVWS